MKKFIEKKYFNCCKKHHKILDSMVLILIGVLISTILLKVMNGFFPDKEKNTEVKQGGYEVTQGIYYE